MSEFTETSDASSPPLPLTKILLRAKSGLQAFIGPPSVSSDAIADANLAIDDTYQAIEATSNLRLAPMYSPDGRFVLFIRESGAPISVHDTSTGEMVCEIACPDVQHVEFSPLGTFVVTWMRPIKQSSTSGGDEGGNLRVWRLATGELVTAASQKVLKKLALQWTADETHFFKIVTNEIHIFDGADISGAIVGKVLHKGMSQYRVSPTSNPTSIAVFNPEAGGKPARVSIYSYPSLGAETVGPTNSRTMFAATEATFHWSATGAAVLVHTHADVDNTNSSYYGATGLFILSSDDKLANVVPQSKDGPIYDVKWAPNGERFVIAAGNMPSQCTMYNIKGEPIYEYGTAHRNTVSWSPHGRFLCIAGFGNLAGEMDFYDTIRMRKLGTNSAHCTVSYSWSPDSRYFLTAVLAPRMNVDNGFKVNPPHKH